MRPFQLTQAFIALNRKEWELAAAISNLLISLSKNQDALKNLSNMWSPYGKMYGDDFGYDGWSEEGNIVKRIPEKLSFRLHVIILVCGIIVAIITLLCALRLSKKRD